MDRREFDKFADEYSVLHSQNVAVTDELPDYFVEYKVRDIYNQMRATGDWRGDLRILDFGSGVGSSIPFYKQYFPSCHIVCVDVSRRSLNLAIGRFGELASYVLFEGKTLPLKSGALIWLSPLVFFITCPCRTTSRCCEKFAGCCRITLAGYSCMSIIL
jgi:hypothetical protein